jgi:PEP-CTERM motif
MMSHMIKMLLVVGLITAPAVSQGGVLVSESFDYTAGPLSGANGGTGWNGAWLTGASTTPTYSVVAQDITPPAGYGAPVGNQALINPNAANDDSGGATPDIRRNLASSIDLDAAQTVYFSALVRREDQTNGGGTEHSTYLRFNSAAGANLVGIGHSSTEDFRLALNNAASDSATVNFQIGINYLLVGKLTLNASGTNDVLEGSLFAPGDTLSEPVAWDHQTAADISGVISQLQIGTQRRAGKAFIDEIRIGTAFADVAVVPEPASVALLGLGGLIVATGHRRHR